MNSTALIMFPIVSPRFSGQKTFTHPNYSQEALQAAVNEVEEFNRRSANQIHYKFKVLDNGKVRISNKNAKGNIGKTLFTFVNEALTKVLADPGYLLRKFEKL